MAQASGNPANPVVTGGGLRSPAPARPNPNRLKTSRVKVSAHIQPDPEDEELALLQQMGVDHCYTWLLPEQVTVHFIQALKQVRDSWPRVSTRPASTAIPIAAC